MHAVVLVAGLLGFTAFGAPSGTAAPLSPERAITAGDSKSVTLRVEKMHCQSCAERIRRALRKAEGVRGVEADPDQKRVVVAFDPAKTDTSKLILELKKAGFSAEELRS